MEYEIAYKGNTAIDPDAGWSVIGQANSIEQAQAVIKADAKRDFKTNDVVILAADDECHEYIAWTHDDGDGNGAELGRYEIRLAGKTTPVQRA